MNLLQGKLEKFDALNMEWATPPEYFAELDREFHFTLDPCSTHENHKCPKYYTKEDDGLTQDWGGERVFCNPPYDRTLTQWVSKCYYESLKPDTLVVMLIPAKTDTTYFHNYIYHRSEIRFIRGRIKFNGSDNPSSFPSMLVIFRAPCLKE